MKCGVFSERANNCLPLICEVPFSLAPNEVRFAGFITFLFSRRAIGVYEKCPGGLYTCPLRRPSGI